MCKTYNRYMMYKLNEFRAKTREAFNKAEAGEEVLIDRHGIIFELSRPDGGYTLDDFRSGKVKKDLEAISGVNDVFKGQSDSGLGTDLHPTTVARITKPEPVVEPIDD